MGFAAPALIQKLDRDLAYTIVAIYNDAMAEWQADGAASVCCPRRLPFWDIEASVKEAIRSRTWA